MTAHTQVDLEMSRAEAELKSLVGREIEAITVNSIDPEDAPFFSLIISKLSPIIGNLLERDIIRLLDEGALGGMSWRRQDPDFPDAALISADGNRTNAGFEVKAWYVSSTELTGRFRESQNLLRKRDVRVVVVAWAMSHIVYGTPKILDVLVVPAMEVAKSRDDHYHNPPDYLIVEPRDTSLRTRNLQQTNVNGYKLQSSVESDLATALSIARGHSGYSADPPSSDAQDLCTELMSTFPYRLDTNFAKIDRIDNDAIEGFKVEVLDSIYHGRQIRQWTSLLRDLNAAATRPQLAQSAAQQVREAFYEGL